MISKEDARKGREMGHDIARCILNGEECTADTVRHLAEYECPPIPLDWVAQTRHDIQIKLYWFCPRNIMSSRAALNLNRRAIMAFLTVVRYRFDIEATGWFLIAEPQGMCQATKRRGAEDIAGASYMMHMHHVYQYQLESSLEHDPEMIGIDSFRKSVAQYEKQLPAAFWFDL